MFSNKVLFLNDFTDNGIVILANDVHFFKAKYLIESMCNRIENIMC